MNVACVITVLVLSASLSPTALGALADNAATPTVALVGPLQNQRVVRGCSWSVSVPNNQGPFFLLAEIDESIAWMHIDGKDIELKVRNSGQGAMSKVGDSFTRVYESKDVWVETTYTVTSVCPPNSEGGCEVTRFAVVLKVRKGAQVQTVPGEGEVGC